MIQNSAGSVLSTPVQPLIVEQRAGPPLESRYLVEEGSFVYSVFLYSREETIVYM